MKVRGPLAPYADGFRQDLAAKGYHPQVTGPSPAADGGSECLAGGPGPLRRRADSRGHRGLPAGPARRRAPEPGLRPGGGPRCWGTCADWAPPRPPPRRLPQTPGGGAAGGVRRLPDKRARPVAEVGDQLPASCPPVPGRAASPGQRRAGQLVSRAGHRVHGRPPQPVGHRNSQGDGDRAAVTAAVLARRRACARSAGTGGAAGRGLEARPAAARREPRSRGGAAGQLRPSQRPGAPRLRDPHAVVPAGPARRRGRGDRAGRCRLAGELAVRGKGEAPGNAPAAGRRRRGPGRLRAIRQAPLRGAPAAGHLARPLTPGCPGRTSWPWCTAPASGPACRSSGRTGCATRSPATCCATARRWPKSASCSATGTSEPPRSTPEKVDLEALRALARPCPAAGAL